VISKQILESDLYFDIIISDFGRRAAIDYLQLLESKERNLICKLLEPESLEFFDEYRRIMLDLIADLNFFKREHIQRLRIKYGRISSEILIGVGNTRVSNLFFDKVLLRIIYAIIPAIKFGYKKIRIAIICNSLSFLIINIVDFIKSEKDLKRFFLKNNLNLDILPFIQDTWIESRTVPEGVIDYVKSSVKSKLNLLILGVKNTNLMYSKLCHNRDINIVSLTNEDYLIIENAVINSLHAKSNLIKLSKEEIKEKIIMKYLPLYDNLQIIEACTDFKFNLGKNSLECFAEYMIAESYNNLII
jgi:hypothetical protein